MLFVKFEEKNGPKRIYQGALKTDFVFITRPIFAQKVSNGAQ